LLQEPEIVVPEVADVVDAEAQHGDALHAEAEGEAGKARGVVAAITQHVGMHHPAAADLQPTAAAHPAASPLALEALDVELSRGLGEREVRGAEARARVRAEQAARHIGERALQVAEGDAFTYRQPFELVELCLVAHVHLLVAVYHPGHDHAHRRGV